MPRSEVYSKGVFVVHDFATTYACEQWMLQAEQQGFDSAPVTTDVGPVMMPGVRNNTRVMTNDVHEANALWERLSEVLPPSWAHVTRHGKLYTACGVNERFRFYRYEPGERFATHRDGLFAREDGSGERSVLTALLYLNEGFEGGETRILEPGQEREIVPAQGLLLCFDHPLLHEGATLTSGCKYVLRTDVMYRPV